MRLKLRPEAIAKLHMHQPYSWQRLLVRGADVCNLHGNWSAATGDTATACLTSSTSLPQWAARILWHLGTCSQTINANFKFRAHCLFDNIAE